MASLKLKLKSAELKRDSTSQSVSGGSTKVKKKKKFMGAGLKIIDPDAICNFNADDKDENPFDPGELNEPDELPQIVDIVDERPKELRLLEEFRQNTKWKTVTEEAPLESFKSRKSKTHHAREGDPKFTSWSRETGKPHHSRSNDASSGRHKGSNSDLSPPRRKTGKGSDSDQSPPRRKRKGGSDSDLSPPRRKRRGGSDSDLSPPRRKRKGGSDSDLSPPRRTGSSKVHKSPIPRRRGGGSDSDLSPPRRENSLSSSSRFKSNNSTARDRHGSPNSYSRSKHERRRDAVSPHRNKEKNVSKSHKSQSGGQKSSKRRNDSDSDLSPPRQRSGSGVTDHHAERRNRSRPEKDDHVRAKTLDGKKAGLQTADALKGELEELRLRELQKFNEMDATVSGRFAQTIVRDRATGKERDVEREREQQKEEQKKLDERKQQYLKWGKGLKQVQEQEERVNSAIHEMSKPLARYKDDEDLDEHLKNIEREGDPMLKYLSSKKGKSGGKGPSKPRYEGPAPQPNRFSIWPGYRWDGVDRSNGYEKDWFAKVNSRKALQEESYKWSVEDL